MGEEEDFRKTERRIEYTAGFISGLEYAIYQAPEAVLERIEEKQKLLRELHSQLEREYDVLYG